MYRYLYPILLSFVFYLPLESSPAYNLSAVTIFRDEAPYLKEWIEYHRLIGVEHFYLYNNLSSDDFHSVIAPYISSGVVTLIEWPYDAKNWAEWDAIQNKAYNDALKLAKRQTEWLAIIDTDEFLVPVQDDTFPKVLARYKKSKKGLGGICIPWVFFGTSHVERIPSDKLLIETLLLNSGPVGNGDALQVFQQGSYKSVVRPKYVTSVPSPHFCAYEKGKSHEMVSLLDAQINHYWTRDEYYLYHFKIPRRQEWGQETQSVIDWANGMNLDTTFSKPILRFIAPLKKRMK